MTSSYDKIFSKTSVIGLSYLTGLLTASITATGPSLTAGGLFLCLGAVLLVTTRRSGRACSPALAALASLGCGAGMLIYGGYDTLVYRDIISCGGSAFVGDVRVTEVTYYRSDSALCTGECTLPCGRRGRVIWYSDSEDMVRGDRVRLSGTLRRLESTSFYDREGHYRSKGIFLSLSVSSAARLPRERGFRAAMEDFRGRAVGLMRRYVPSEEGELIAGMVFGSSRGLSESTRRALYRTGIGHILSVSGMHMAIAAQMACAAASCLLVPKRARLLPVAAVCALFAAAAGMSISAVRSLIMIILVYSADSALRQSDPLTSLCIAAAALTLPMPFAVSDPSFMLSFSGTLGAAVIAPAVIKAAGDDEGRPRMNTLLSAAITSVCASAAVLPASVICFGGISLAAPLANLVLSPVYSAAIMAAAAGAALTLLPFEWLSGGLFLGAGILAKALLAVSELTGRVKCLYFPAGLDIVPPMTALLIIAALFAVFAVRDRLTAALTVCAAAAVCALSASVYRCVPSGAEDITLLTDGKGGVLLIQRDGRADIIDFSGTRSGASAAVELAEKRGACGIRTVCAAEKCGASAAVYGELCPEALMITAAGDASAEKYGLTYRAEDNIIKADGFAFYPHEGYFIIETEGIRIAAVSGKAVPDGHFDLCIYNCPSQAGNVPVSADNYAVTDSRFGGLLPAGAPCSYGGGEYTARDGALLLREDGKWLR